MRAVLCVVVSGMLTGVSPVLAQPMSADALTVLSTIGYLVGAANQCGVASDYANVAASGMAAAISQGGYGDATAAHTLYNGAVQRGAAGVRTGKANCDRVAEMLVGSVDRMLTRSSRQ